MKLVRLLLPGLGLLLLGYLIGKIGAGEIVRNLLSVKWAFPLVLALAGLWHITNSCAWRSAFPPGVPRPTFASLFMAKLAGDAVNQLTPLANLGGEPLKAYLVRHQTPTARGLASVVVNKTAQVFSGLVFTAVGLGLVSLHWEMYHPIPLAMRVGLAALLALGLLFSWLLYRRQTRLFSSFLSLLRRAGLKTEFIEKKMAQAIRIDLLIGQLYHEHPGRLGLVLSFHALGWLLGVVETFVILRALGVQAELEVAFLITALTVIINSLFFFMPSNIGVLEGGQVFLFVTLGLDPALGLSLGIVKRMRKVFWISVGWLLLVHLTRRLARDEQSAHLRPSPAAAAGNSVAQP
jgi:uncharacterized protein (TIRG00374 family)